MKPRVQISESLCESNTRAVDLGLGVVESPTCRNRQLPASHCIVRVDRYRLPQLLQSFLADAGRPQRIAEGAVGQTRGIGQLNGLLIGDYGGIDLAALELDGRACGKRIG